MPKILLVAPMFFPDPVVGAIRVTQWARHLPEFGWTPLVLTRHHGHDTTPEELAERLHPDVRLEYLGPRLSPAGRQAKRAAGWGTRVKQLLAKEVLDQLAVPDALVWKWKAFSRQAFEIADRWQPDVVLSSSPPHSIHWLGRELARRRHVAWVADFRDPYLIDSRYRPRGLRWLVAPQHKRFERGIYRDAALCVHAIPMHGRWAARRYAFARDKIRILPNGIPPALLETPLERPAQVADGPRRKTLLAAGIMGREAVETVAAALRQLVEKGIDVEFRQLGAPRAYIEAVPLELRSRIELRGPVSHEEALREVAAADVLLNYLAPERANVSGLSSKLFEYLATGRPIVTVNPTRADRHLIGRLPWCWCVRDPQPAALAAAFQQAITCERGPEESWLSAFRNKYNRRHQTRQLAGWLDELLPSRRLAAGAPSAAPSAKSSAPPS